MTGTGAAESLRERVSAEEWETRVNLAAAFRLGYHYGWNDRIINHITARVPDEPEHFLMNPHGLGWHEVTASSLVKVDFSGRIVSDGEASLAPAGLNFHSAILQAKSHIACVVHVHPTAGIVISATRQGLIIVDQSSCQLHGEVAYHEFEGYADATDEAPRIVADLGDRFTMIMWNHGLLSVGRTIAEAFAYMRKLVTACEIQERLMATGAEIRAIPPEVLDHTVVQSKARGANRPYGGAEWRMGLRLAERLDPGFRT